MEESLAGISSFKYGFPPFELAPLTPLALISPDLLYIPHISLLVTSLLLIYILIDSLGHVVTKFQMAAIALFTLSIFVDYISWGSVVSILFIPWLIFLISFLKKRDYLAGSVIGLCMFKSQLIILPLGILTLIGYKHISKKLIISSISSAFFFGAIPFIYRPTLINDYLTMNKEELFHHSSLAFTLPALFPVNEFWLRNMIGSGLLVGAFFIFFKFRDMKYQHVNS